MTFNAIILGTDHNSYSVARSFYEAFGKKPIVIGAAVLVPFINQRLLMSTPPRGFHQTTSFFKFYQ